MGSRRRQRRRAGHHTYVELRPMATRTACRSAPAAGRRASPPIAQHRTARRRRHHDTEQHESSVTRRASAGPDLPRWPLPRRRSFNTGPPPSRAPPASLRDELTLPLDTDDPALTAAWARKTGRSATTYRAIEPAPPREPAVKLKQPSRSLSPNQLTLWTRAELGTTWGPHAVRDHERAACQRTSRDLVQLALTCGNGYSNVLGVKGSQVQILSARRTEATFT